MQDFITLDISTPEKEFFTGEIVSLIITTTEGEMGVLPGHMPMVVALDIAPVKFKTDRGWLYAVISGGFAQITGKNVDILADSAEWPEEIDVNRALEAKRRAEERLRSNINEVEYIRSQIAKRRALTRIAIADKKIES